MFELCPKRLHNINIFVNYFMLNNLNIVNHILEFNPIKTYICGMAEGEGKIILLCREQFCILFCLISDFYETRKRRRKLFMKFENKHKGEPKHIILAVITACAICILIIFTRNIYINKMQQKPDAYKYPDAYNGVEQETASRADVYLPEYSSMPDETIARIVDADEYGDDIVSKADDAAGKDGENGRDGALGKGGKNGADGAVGKSGENGKDGTAGKSGGNGKDGTTGKGGENGKDGTDGKGGENGKDGTDGKSGENGKDGTTGKSGEDGRDGAIGKDGKNGKDGAAGKDGEDGKDGAAGENGRDGKDGVDGKDGKNGKDGATGKDGKNGKDGTDGKDGENGKDAYEIAVDAGFSGTRSEWLQSIKGKDGAFSDYKIISSDNNVFLYKGTD